MNRLVAAAALCSVLLAACSVDELTLTQAEVDDLVANFEAAQIAYTDLANFTLDVALGEAEIDGFTYDEPRDDNGWTGTLSFTGDALPSGSGTLLLTFQVIGDEGPVDPFAVDLSNDESIRIDGEVSFDGTSVEGAPLSADGTFSWVASFDFTAETATVQLSGDVLVSHNDYVAHLLPRDFALTFDFDGQAPTGSSGLIEGDVDIPNFAFDALVEIAGVGANVETTVDIVGNSVTWVTPVADF